MQNKSNNNKHLSFDDRVEIQECLYKKMTFKDIAKKIGKASTTVSREVNKHKQIHSSSFSTDKKVCPLLCKAPFVCNGCDKRNKASCRCTRILYSAKNAQKEYEETLSDSRSGIPLNKQEFYDTEKIVSDAISKGQHIYHIANSYNLPVSISTIYRHIRKGYYSISPIDLPRMVKFKPRRKNNEKHVPYKIKKNRQYNDFIEYIEGNHDLSKVQLDTVIGRSGGKTIMTVHFIETDFMIGLLLDNKTAVEAANKFTSFKERLAHNGVDFHSIAPVLLTDNGGEFAKISAFEEDHTGEIKSRLFFCEPNAPYEKPEIEKNHTLFRDIVPKETSFDSFTQDTVNLIFSHVNAVKRKQFNGKSAYDMFTFTYSEDIARAMGITKIEPQNVVQTPQLLK